MDCFCLKGLYPTRLFHLLTSFYDLKHYEEYDQGSYHEDSYRSHTSQTNSHPHHLQTGWDPQNGVNYQYQNGDCAGTDESHGTDFSSVDGAEQDAYPHDALRNGAGYHEEEAQSNGLNYGAHASARNQFQVRLQCSLCQIS